ncbi:hypothetical protein FRACYDRAFT_233476 [Fragilariopsis cylindrus CCMP1102]|uniref:Uncharacterized protein n=1 Tax=Fragilariopsis cylindrus CCMP1102 TaxID=635003 RepID=A0A1E7FYV6_9STRA|nr:hypothetical protein FRACYDRAFT_233476 [Fragilariopsis cylindrus CCMP1102]|eukprot:OEU23304.1 hypothetical protein FRACYDRAFT_233476 [Fragilariopsis cylindrus CCMP1102]
MWNADTCDYDDTVAFSLPSQTTPLMPPLIIPHNNNDNGTISSRLSVNQNKRTICTSTATAVKRSRGCANLFSDQMIKRRKVCDDNNNNDNDETMGISRSVSAVNANANVNVNVNVNGYYSNVVMHNNSCLHCEKKEEYKYLHSVEELKRKAIAEDEAKEKAGAGAELRGCFKLDDDEDNEDDDYEYDEYDEDEDYEDNEDLEQEEDDEFDREEKDEEEDEEEYEYTSEEIEIMERLYEEYCLVLFEDIGVDCDEDYELEFKEVVYDRYLEWKNTPEDVEEEEEEEDQEEIDTKGREQDIHEALQRYRLEPSSTPPSLAFRDITDDTTNIALAYIELPARMIGVIKISDALPISSLNNDEQQQQQQNDGDDASGKMYTDMQVHIPSLSNMC